MMSFFCGSLAAKSISFFVFQVLFRSNGGSPSQIICCRALKSVNPKYLAQSNDIIDNVLSLA